MTSPATISLQRLPYCPDAFTYSRRPTRVVMVGDVGVGGDHPIRVQSMTTTRTQDLDGTVAQAERLVRAGCEIVRITAPTVQDARAIGEVRRQLRAKGITTPLVADIHFSPAAALAAADHVEKVRINPGNYADSRTFAVREYTDAEYQRELERIEERFTPLVLKCKQLGIAMRVGTNHGSLSDRIMNRFGDTPLGMVESALEFLHICVKHGYRDVILSMKASNPKVMIQAYRLLVARMDAIGMDFPLHLGVTEAGNDEDGRIKSAVGIGTLLDDGLGDTIRVSLTEEPEAEIPVAVRLAAPYQNRPAESFSDAILTETRDPYTYTRRLSAGVKAGPVTFGANETVLVIRAVGDGTESVERALDLVAGQLPGSPQPDVLRIDAHRHGVAGLSALRAGLTEYAPNVAIAAWFPGNIGSFDQYALADVLWTEPVRDSVARELLHAAKEFGCAVLLEHDLDGTEILNGPTQLVSAAQEIVDAGLPPPILALRGHGVSSTIRGYRALADSLDRRGLRCPLHLVAPLVPDPYDRLLRSSVALGSLLCDGIGDSVEIPPTTFPSTVRLAFNILQASGARISKTEFVACPSCGRTLFDLQPTTDRIKARTGHLKGVKIAIMGCVVNGPGEMADADFGYVGGAPGKVNLYVGKECVERNVPQEEADDRLVALIQSHGRWVEPAS